MQQNAMKRVPHPQYSRDLALSDFYLFNYIKQLLLGCEFTDRDSLLQGVRDILRVLKKPLWKASFATGWRYCTNLVQWVESMWSQESFYTSRISRNSLDPEMLMGGWETLSFRLNDTNCEGDRLLYIQILISKVKHYKSQSICNDVTVIDPENVQE
jgi:hypothetical protein